ncbi:hypothetical protein METBIDRAFT_173237 [Metschnikowia bicuspidata var. bicuspidata NRRL YB-4993]|uniref:Uncharacterized protein n=1 Tax=Metschnikowia bicuspidata var. bicuspidata NRRL YB-4993 TaxID=869754 RepID=A0A1A0HAM2_9ASCO|nr:hypothetical protein METBIDRAFT_173237 [Metschnikowia bicuspidata var. bicuspidata NRRL YB-4993]OBA21061.1 hypothetical protein METBIDRAFT_173237 [Metschnikowia bicuspidata var. bicuspidata NRRL YB-4993]
MSLVESAASLRPVQCRKRTPMLVRPGRLCAGIFQLLYPKGFLPSASALSPNFAYFLYLRRFQISFGFFTSHFPILLYYFPRLSSLLLLSLLDSFFLPLLLDSLLLPSLLDSFFLPLLLDSLLLPSLLDSLLLPSLLDSPVFFDFPNSQNSPDLSVFSQTSVILNFPFPPISSLFPVPHVLVPDRLGDASRLMYTPSTPAPWPENPGLSTWKLGYTPFSANPPT